MNNKKVWVGLLVALALIGVTLKCELRSDILGMSYSNIDYLG